MRPQRKHSRCRSIYRLCLEDTVFRQKIIPVLLSVFLGLSVFYFIFGDLGILASYEKTLTARNLQRELDKLSLIQLKKSRELDRLEKDPATIRHYALLYGMQGGAGLEPLPEAQDADIDRVISKLGVPDKGAFLLRHPILIVLALLISLSLFAYFLISRRHNALNRETAPPKNRKTGGYINPSWG
jgi:hypothetical protein